MGNKGKYPLGQSKVLAFILILLKKWSLFQNTTNSCLQPFLLTMGRFKKLSCLVQHQTVF